MTVCVVHSVQVGECLGATTSVVYHDVSLSLDTHGAAEVCLFIPSTPYML